jgi:hypothetical protein
MNLSHREQRALTDIRLWLSREAPELVSRFLFFNRLVAGEGPPPRELPGRH